jgi:hypothetical protein
LKGVETDRAIKKGHRGNNKPSALNEATFVSGLPEVAALQGAEGRLF